MFTSGVLLLREGNSLETGALASAFGIGHKMVLHADALLLVEVHPAFWKEGVRVWENVGVGLVEYRGHADDGLEIV